MSPPNTHTEVKITNSSMLTWPKKYFPLYKANNHSLCALVEDYGSGNDINQ